MVVLVTSQQMMLASWLADQLPHGMSQCRLIYHDQLLTGFELIIIISGWLVCMSAVLPVLMCSVSTESGMVTAVHKRCFFFGGGVVGGQWK